MRNAVRKLNGMRHLLQVHPKITAEAFNTHIDGACEALQALKVEPAPVEAETEDEPDEGEFRTHPASPNRMHEGGLDREG